MMSPFIDQYKMNDMMTLTGMTIRTNKATKHFVAKVFSHCNQSCEVALFSLEGRRIRTHFSNAVKGLNQIYFDIRDVEPGVYFVQSSIHPGEKIRVEVNK